MQEAEIYQILTGVFEEVFDRDNIVLNANTTAADVPGWDSINQINIIVTTEIRFDIRFGVKDIDSLKTIGDLVALIEEKKIKTL